MGRFLEGGDSGSRLHAFRTLATNRPLVRILAAYGLFVLTECTAWIAMLVFGYSRGGAAVASFVAVAQLVPAAVLAPVTAAIADRRSPVTLLAGGYLVQAAGWPRRRPPSSRACRSRPTPPR